MQFYEGHGSNQIIFRFRPDFIYRGQKPLDEKNVSKLRRSGRWVGARVDDVQVRQGRHV